MGKHIITIIDPYFSAPIWINRCQKNEYNQWGQSVFNHSTNVCENNILRAFLSIPTRLFTLKTTSNWDFLYSWDNHVIAKWFIGIWLLEKMRRNLNKRINDDSAECVSDFWAENCSYFYLLKVNIFYKCYFENFRHVKNTKEFQPLQSTKFNTIKKTS